MLFLVPSYIQAVWPLLAGATGFLQFGTALVSLTTALLVLIQPVRRRARRRSRASAK
jgi:hypothetical protein